MKYFLNFQEVGKRASESPERSEKKENAKTGHTEFGGAFGTFMMMLFLPATLYYINMACSKVI
jgi:hypothetical protein